MMSYLFKRKKIYPVILTYIFTTILVIAYTIFLQILPSLSPRPEGEYLCLPPIFIIIVPLLPISLFAQAIFNINTKNVKRAKIISGKKVL